MELKRSFNVFSPNEEKRLWGGAYIVAGYHEFQRDDVVVTIEVAGGCDED